MHFRVEPTGLEHPSEPKFVIISDADVAIAYTMLQPWADHIATLLTKSGEDVDTLVNDDRVIVQRQCMHAGCDNLFQIDDSTTEGDARIYCGRGDCASITRVPA